MLKKKVNGSWSNISDVKRKTNGSWSDCTSVQKKYNGSWFKVWGTSSVYVDFVYIINYSDGTWATTSNVVEYSNPQVYSTNFRFETRGSTTSSTSSSRGLSACLKINLNAGENLYIRQKYIYNKEYDMTIYAYAVLFDGKLTSSSSATPLAKTNLTTDEQVIILTPSSNASYLYLYLGFKNSYTYFSLPNFILNVYDIKSDSGKYTFY